MGGTYGVSVVPEFTKLPTEEYRLTITFACDPARTQDLVKAMFAVIEQFRTAGPSAGQVADAQAGLRRDLETDSRQNGYVLSQLTFAYQYRRADSRCRDAARTLRSIDPAASARCGPDLSRSQSVREGAAVPRGQIAPLDQPFL